MHTKSKGHHTASFAFILEDNLKAYREFIKENGSSVSRMPEGTTISNSGFPSPCVYFLLDGIVKVSIINVSGYERILGYHKRNSIFAMDGLHRDQSVIVTTTAVTPISVIRLSKEDLTGLFAKNPLFATDLVIYYSDVLKLMCYDAESQSSNSVKSRLANFIILYMQSDDYHTLGYLPFSQTELASAIGASRIQVARTCAEFKQKAFIEVKKRKIFVRNQGGLYKFVSFRGFE